MSQTAPIGIDVSTVSTPLDRPEPAGGLENLMAKVRRWADEAEPALLEARMAQNFYDGKQLTSDEIKVLSDRQQPAIIANRIKPAINGIVGVIEKGRTDPKAWPRTENDEPSADLATDVLRYIADRNRMQSMKSAMLTEELIWGWTAAVIEVEPDREVKLRRIRPEEFIWDPSSRERDLSDASFLGIGMWRYIDQIMVDYPDVSEDEIKISLDGGFGDQPSTAEDRPNIWGSYETKRVFQVDLYYRIGSKWYRCVFIRNTVLRAVESEYQDTKGRSRCPIEGVRAYVDIDNRPYGVIRDMFDPQREMNARRSRLLHELATRQVMAEEGVIDDEPAFKMQMARSDGLVKVAAGAIQSGRVQVMDRSDKAQFQHLLLQESRSEIERQGPNPGVLGRDVQGQSGRAILAQQQAGLMELAPLLGWFDDFILRLYRQMWGCSQQFGTAEDMIRITDDAGRVQFKNTWEPVLDPATGGPAMEPVPGPDGQPATDPATGQPAMQPVKRNRLAEADVDLVLDSSPDVAVIEEEQFQAFSDVLPIIAPLAPQLLPVLLKGWLAASSFRNKHEMIQAMDQGQQQDPKAAALEQEQMRLTLENASATVDKTKSEGLKNMADVKLKAAQTSKTIADAHAVAAGVHDSVRHAAREELGEDDASLNREHQADQSERDRQVTREQAAQAARDGRGM